MSDPAPLADARELGAIPDLPVEFHAKAYTYTGFARYSAGRWPADAPTRTSGAAIRTR